MMPRMHPGPLLATFASLAVLGAVVVGIVLLDPPAVQRQHKFDARRIDELLMIERSIDLYARQHGQALPADLTTLAAQPGVHMPVRDPETGRAYEYLITGAESYQLCAVFTHDSRELARPPMYGAMEWAHGKGRHCFGRRWQAKPEHTGPAPFP